MAGRFAARGGSATLLREGPSVCAPHAVSVQYYRRRHADSFSLAKKIRIQRNVLRSNADFR